MGDVAVVDVVGGVDVVVNDVADVDVWWSMTRLASTWLAGIAMAFVDVVIIVGALFIPLQPIQNMYAHIPQ